MTKTRVVLPVLAAAAAAALAISGCGDSDSSASDLASVAPPGSLVFVEGKVQPTEEMGANVDSLAQEIADVSDLGELIVEELESSAEEDGEPVDFAAEVEPWLGEKAGISFERLGDDGLSEPVIAVESTDPEATQDFIDAQAEQGEEPYEDVSYEGVEFKVGGAEDSAYGLVGDKLLIADGEAAFKKAVDASSGESLADEAGFERAIGAASEGSLADVYVDIGGLLEQSEDEIDPQAQEALASAGIDPSEATAVASVIPGSDQIQIDISSDLGGEEAPSGDVSKLLDSLPWSSFAVAGVSGFGDQLEEAIDELDKSGIPGELPPNQLKSSLKAMGIDLDKIAASVEDAAVFAWGSDRRSLGGALVLTTSSGEAAKTVADLGVLLRNTSTPGVTVITGKASGFSIRSPELGRQPLVVLAREDRVAIGYGRAAARAGLFPGTDLPLTRSSDYEAAVAALGATPVSAFVDRSLAMFVAKAFVPRSESGFWEAVPYLEKFDYLAIGTETDDGLVTAKLVLGLAK
jgi:hypothetical protein